MLTLGVDPGLLKTGYGLIRSDGGSISYVASGTILTKADMPIEKRLRNIFDRLTAIIDDYEPDCFSLEETFVNNNPTSSLKLGQARGTAILCAGLKGLKVYEYKPNTIKKSVTGVGKAAKGQVVTMVKYLLPLADPKTEDEADALAIAICHVNSMVNWVRR